MPRIAYLLSISCVALQLGLHKEFISLLRSFRLCGCLGLAMTLSCSSYEPVYEIWPVLDASSSLPAPDGATPIGPAEAGTDARGNAAGDPNGTGGSGGVDPGPDPTGAGGSGGTGVTAGMGGAGRDSGATDATAGSRGGGDAGAIVRSDAGAGTGCTLAVTLTTVTDNGRYSPRNVGAIWIANGSGKFVKTLGAWARTRISRLTLWSSVSAAAGLSRNTVDAVTSATLSSHQTHNVTWNCKDTTGAVVPDGSYQLSFEMADDNATGPHGTVSFTKGPMPLQMSAPDSPNFKGITLRLTP